MWAEDIDDITIEFEEDGIQVVRQEAREVVARGVVGRRGVGVAHAHSPLKFGVRFSRKAITPSM